MKAHSGLTFVELLLAGFILSTVAFGAISGMLHIADFVDKRSEMLAAEEYCWDLAWVLFYNDDTLKYYLEGAKDENSGMPAYPEIVDRPSYFEVRGEVRPAAASSKEGDFLAHLRTPACPPICTIVFSNRYDSACQPDKEHGIYIDINLEWGPPNRRRMLVRTPETSDEDIESGRAIVFNHPIRLFRSNSVRSR